MGDSEPVRAAVKEPSFHVGYGAWINFVNRRPNSIAGRSICLMAAQEGNEHALAQWSDWLLHVANLRARGDL